MLVCLLPRFRQLDCSVGHGEGSNLAFSIKTLHLKVMTLFHFKLNTFYIRLCLLPCFLQRYIRG